MQQYTVYRIIWIYEFTLLARRIAPSVILFQLPGAISISPYVNNLQKETEQQWQHIKLIETYCISDFLKCKINVRLSSKLGENKTVSV
jgi:hypothetical protein